MISTIETLALNTKAKIAIGVESNTRLRGRTIAGAIQAKIKQYADPILVGKDISTQFEIESINTNTPEKTLVSLLMNNEVDGIVRGSLQAANILKIWREEVEKLTKSISIQLRFALINNSLTEHSLLLSPIGIEEGHTLKEKELIIELGVKLLSLLGITPKISVLAAGTKKNDMYRHNIADQTINDSEALIQIFRHEVDISTPGILIEQAFEDRKNFVIPMDGVTGNLLYRTLVHVGNWESYGAVLLFPGENIVNNVFIDTSHRGSVHDYQRALIFASAIVGTKI